MKCIRMLTFIPVSEIDEMETWDDSRINEKKAILAYSLTELVHGTEHAKEAKKTSEALFGGEGDDSHMPSTVLDISVVSDGGISLVEMLVLGNLAKSKGEARRLIEQGGIRVNDVKIADINHTVSVEDLRAGVKVRKGKKIFHRFSCEI